MKKVLERVFVVLPHINIALAVTLIVCFVIDQINRMMEFMNNDITKWMVFIFALLSIVQSVIYIIFSRK